MLNSRPTATYDKVHDVLYIYFTDPRPSVGEFSDICDSIVFKYALDNDELIGIVILSFSRLDIGNIQAALPPTVDLDKVLQ
jgi:uncharacterized protein YuzE